MNYTKQLAFICFFIVLFNYFACASYDTIGAIEREGYSAELHYVTTEDGYILGLQRIPYSGKSQKPKRDLPVVIVHGLQSSSTDWVGYDNKTSLAFHLAAEGYDLWLVNVRGVPWSINHTTLDPVKDAKQYWNFCLDEIAYYDLPAVIDFILETTSSKQLHYIGMSQGSTVAFMLFARRTEYNDKVRLFSSLCGVVYTDHSRNVLFNTLAIIWSELEMVTNLLGLYEIPGNDVIRSIGQRFCGYIVFRSFCLEYLWLTGGFADPDQIEKSKLPKVYDNYPASASMRQVVQYLQFFNAKKFRRYDYGQDKNLALYGSQDPPEYNIKNVVVPLAYYYGSNDHFTSVEDAEELIHNAPNLVKQYNVPYEKFNHVDFILSKDVVHLLYNSIIETINQYN